MSEPLRIQIQKTIRELILAAPAYRVYYDRDLTPTIHPDAPEALVPHVLVNETAAGWELDERNRRDLQQMRREWEFVAKCKWDSEVSLELVEEHLGQALTSLRRVFREAEGDNPKRRAILLYRGMDVDHPTTNRSSEGTRCDFRFSVLQWPF